jgi:ABC-type transporter MlaC component
MSLSVHMLNMAARSFIAGAMLVVAFQAQAQTESSATESSANIPLTPSEPAAPTESSAKLDTETDTEAKTEKSAPEQPVKTKSSDSSVEAFVAKLDSGTRAIHEKSKNDPVLIRQGCRDLLQQILDLDTMAKDVDAELWEKLTPPQRETFRGAFEHRMIASCVKQLGDYEGQNLQLLGIRTAQGGNLLATIRVGSQEDGKLVTWRLRNSGSERWRAIDVITEGRSMVGDARVEFAAVLQSMNGDIEALIAFLQK